MGIASADQPSLSPLMVGAVFKPCLHLPIHENPLAHDSIFIIFVLSGRQHNILEFLAGIIIPVSGESFAQNRNPGRIQGRQALFELQEIRSVIFDMAEF
jgi:hypothetical protein